MKLSGKVILVTGASSGLGEQICYEAAKAGAIVVACARRIQLIGAVKERCMEYSNQPAFAFQLDVSQPQQVDHVLARIEEEVGAIDVLVNDAGYGIFDDFVATPYEEIRNMFEVNVLGLMYITKRVAIKMIERGDGQVINIASIAGKMATPKSSVYAATKFAVLGFSNALRLELKPFHVSVTTVNPGPMETPFFERADPDKRYLARVKPFLTDPTALAKKIVNSIGKPKREINQPLIMEVAAKAYVLFPRVGDYLASGIFNKK